MSLRSLVVSLTHADGPLGRPPRLRLALYLSGFRETDGVQAAESVADRGRGYSDFPVGVPVFDALCRAAEEAGFESRRPVVEAVADTSDRGAGVRDESGRHDLTGV